MLAPVYHIKHQVKAASSVHFNKELIMVKLGSHYVRDVITNVEKDPAVFGCMHIFDLFFMYRAMKLHG